MGSYETPTSKIPEATFKDSQLPPEWTSIGNAPGKPRAQGSPAQLQRKVGMATERYGFFIVIYSHIYIYVVLWYIYIYIFYL
jgi:hypothetical protein